MRIHALLYFINSFSIDYLKLKCFITLENIFIYETSDTEKLIASYNYYMSILNKVNLAKSRLPMCHKLLIYIKCRIKEEFPNTNYFHYTYLSVLCMADWIYLEELKYIYKNNIFLYTKGKRWSSVFVLFLLI